MKCGPLLVVVLFEKWMDNEYEELIVGNEMGSVGITRCGESATAEKTKKKNRNIEMFGWCFPCLLNRTLC
jgi:hypothetical protein